MLILSMAFVIITFMRLFLFEILTDWGFTISSIEIEVDEDLPNFYKAIKISDINWFVKESDYLEQNYKFSFANASVV